jgi:probable HAF family extracellular repeat protein
MDATRASGRRWHRRLALLAGTLVATSVGALGASAEPYALVDLGVGVSPEDVNDRQVVVGARQIAPGMTTAFVYTPADGMLQDLEGTIAHAVNDAGLIAGDTLTGAFLFDLFDGSSYDEFPDLSARGISENGLVSGYWAAENPYRTSPRPLAPALYDPYHGTWQILEIANVYPRGRRQGVYADLYVLTDVNQAGYAVGTKSRYGLHGSSAILTPPEFDRVIYLPLPSGGRAAAINGDGLVVGTTAEDPSAGSSGRAFLYDGTSVTDLGTLGGGLRSSASDINASGQVVGDSWLSQVNTSVYQPDQYHAFLWEDGPGMRDLNDLVTAPGWTLTSATAINDAGDIVGDPVPPPPAGEPPVAVASSNRTRGKAPLVVQFSSSGSYDPDGSQLHHTWYFGDGAVSNEPDPWHTYQEPGVFVATLTVEDAQGQSAVAEVEITVRGSKRHSR